MQEISFDELIMDDNGVIEISSSFKDEEENYPNPYQSLIREQPRTRPTNGVKRSSFNLEESYNDRSQSNSNSSEGLSQSFSALNVSTKDDNTFKSKLRTNRSQIRGEQDYYPTEKELEEYHMSIFCDRPSNNLGGANRGSSEKDRASQEQDLNSPIPAHQPFEMKPIIPVPIETSSKVVTKPRPSSQSQFKLILRSTNYFLQRGNGDSVMVNGQMLRDLYDEFFKQELFIPLFKYERFDEWNQAKDKFNPDLDAHRIFKVALHKYIEFVTGKYPTQFQQVFKVLQEIQRGKVAKKREQAAFSFLNFDLASVLESLKQYMSSTKTQVLRKTLLSKIRAIQQVLRIVQTQQGEALHQAQALRQKMEQLWQQFGSVQLLLNFQETEYYCSKKIDNSPQPKFKQIWVKYRQAMRIEKAHQTDAHLRNILI